MFTLVFDPQQHRQLIAVQSQLYKYFRNITRLIKKFSNFIMSKQECYRNAKWFFAKFAL